MKHFKLNGDTAYWKHGLNFDVLNLNTLETDATSPIPSDKRMWVNVVSNLYKVEGKEREVLKGEISESDKNALLSQIKSNTPDFILSLGGKVVGYANLHHRKGCAVSTNTEDSKSQKAQVNISDIVDDSLTLKVTLVPKSTEESLNYLARLKRELSCKNGIKRIAIINHAQHTLHIEDIPIKVLEEEYNGNVEDYIRDKYLFMHELSWDYVTDVEYTPNGGEAFSIEPSDFID